MPGITNGMVIIILADGDKTTTKSNDSLSAQANPPSSEIMETPSKWLMFFSLSKIILPLSVENSKKL